MADYLPLLISDIVERTNPETGEIRKNALCRTVQPEQITLNLSRLDATRLQRFIDNKGSVLMVPIRRGEINGRSFTSIADGHIFRDPDVVATFELSDSRVNSPALDGSENDAGLVQPSASTPIPEPPKAADKPKSLFEKAS